MALHKLGRNQEALDMLSSAIDTDHKNPLARFEKAHVLMATDHLHAALQELETLKVSLPLFAVSCSMHPSCLIQLSGW